MIAIGSFSVPAALVQQTSVTQSFDFMDLISRASRRAPADTYDCEDNQRKKRPVSSMLKMYSARYASSRFRTTSMPRSTASLSTAPPWSCSLTDLMPVRDKKPRK